MARAGAVTIVMEYMDAGALSDVIKNKPISEAYIAEIARQVRRQSHAT